MSFAGKKKGAFSVGGSASAPATAKVQAPPAGSKGKQRAVDIFNAEDEDEEEEDDEDEEFDDGDDDLDDEEDVDDYGLDDEEEEDDEADTDEEIEAAKAAVTKSSQTAKRKRRATSPGAFGSTLQSLLGGGPDADDAGDQESGDEPDDDDSVSAAGPPKKKNKGRQQAVLAPGSITTATTGTALASSRPSAILSLAPHLRRTLTSQKLNAKASRLATQQRKMREERAHVTDVIGGWGPPGVLPAVDEAAWDQLGAAKRKKKEKEMMGGNVIGSKRLAVGGIVPVDETDKDQRAWLEEGGSRAYERKLRKVAQRGVVKLFNAIRAAQTASLEDVESGPAPDGAAPGAESVKKPVMPGGKEAALSNLSKSNFLDLIRSGTGKAK
ncbi:hypothetical protein CF327_g4766 [Tilletia walkeri]|uniref:Rrp15p-domain-containing protein n=1 Tax=Tilletia walkeri TaxID=117179 RepID=A0A8X7NAG5_9BASI|nr:hypothetical protein CF327_g4766 [Tilletia walkeri]KAE8268495.1 hypothetical protein A4X09_0g3857 [Tilletia walkeri]